MGWDYAFVHLKFTIPLALILTVVSRPVLTKLDAARILFLVTIAVTATIPWDSHLIRTGVWTYPEDGILGLTLWSIPAEELFFFVIQTYITGTMYILCSKPGVMAQYLSTPSTRPQWISRAQLAGSAALVALTSWGGYLVAQQTEWTYMGLILAWACPFLLITWTMTGDMLLAMPLTSTLLPIVLSTLYLWFVDELSLRNGVWTIESGTKVGRSLFGSLDIEEAVFFLITNTLVVFGIAAFDKAVAVCDAHPDTFPEPSNTLPIKSLLRARVFPSSEYDTQRIQGIREAVARLQRKSRSFYMASSVFPGRLRIDLTLLYSFCRLADDLIDDGRSVEEGTVWIAKLRQYLDLCYGDADKETVHEFIRANFDPSAYSALDLLPTHILSEEPLRELLAGFETDLEFTSLQRSPIRDEFELEVYASRVASTIGELCLDLVFHHTKNELNKELLKAAAREMGVALQYVNICRDVSVDAAMRRVYVPSDWLQEEKLSEDAALADPRGPGIERLRKRLLGKAFHKYRESRIHMELIPREARGPMIVAVESYMEIGRVLSEGGLRREGKATVPRMRRLGVVWKTLMAN